MDCPQNLKVSGLSSDRFKVSFTVSEPIRTCDPGFLLDAFMSDLIDVFGDNFIIYLDNSHPTVVMEFVFPYFMWLWCFANKASEFQEKVGERYIMPKMEVTFGNSDLRNFYKVVVKSGIID